MRPSRETRVALDALIEPVLVLSRDGAIAFANGAARDELGAGATLADVIGAAAAGSLAGLLARAEGATKPLVGGVVLPERGRVKAFANLVVPGHAGEPALVMLRLALRELDRFGVLQAKLEELDAEVRQRRHVEARLRESLAERELLMRELHHRVKNNVQMLVGTVATARRGVDHPEAREALAAAERRLVAVGAVQQMLYHADDLRGLPARRFLEVVGNAVLAAHGSSVVPDIAGDDSEVENDIAAPLAVILNELVANALKYGPDHAAALALDLRSRGDELRLAVADGGFGFDLPETGRRSSGLGLVRGLLRQLGGAIHVERGEGARVIVDVRRRIAAAR
ncbi:sensor histidine kinase [Salinarimonas ramus]|uniref:histidine kinase n=1 Tax=Salinarimonas ramus TaxID=690164 RepID=A0A917V4R3_9HYPH|nr:sensor histidine kinase [Salinarimonas ramus]GGK39599.1 ATPase [Salinarimonas ramus]